MSDGIGGRVVDTGFGVTMIVQASDVSEQAVCAIISPNCFKK